MSAPRTPAPSPGITPDNTRFVLLSFEGPDGYSLAGGLGTRERELSAALAQQGYRTDLYFVGDPDLPGEEAREEGRLVLHRWCQWISAHHRGGVYDGETGKVEDYAHSIPSHVIERVVGPAIREHHLVVVLAEEWHTAGATINLSDRLHARGWRDRVVVFWNANNTMGFEHVNWPRLAYTATLTTVSRFMKQAMWDYGVNATVIPNGIPSRLLEQPPGDPQELRERMGDRLLLVKVARFDPDKRWLQAVSAAGGLKRLGIPVHFVMRGGVEPHGSEVLWTAQQVGLTVADVQASGRPSPEECLDLLVRHADADVLNLRFYVPEEFLRLLYRSADAVLANSGREPFGLVGLEVMASGGVAFTGATGEDYVRPFENAIAIETDDPREIVSAVAHLRAHPEHSEQMRAEGRATAERYTWDVVIEGLRRRLEMQAFNQGLLEWSGIGA